MENKGILKIGLTGGIGTGKSTVSNLLKEININVIDADVIAREVLKIYPDILIQIKKNFGEEFIDNEGQLKRKQFGNYIFKNKLKRKQYEDIIMPYIIKEIFNQIKALEKKGVDLCVLDAPVLIEQGLHEFMDFNILIWASRQIQINRVMKRDNLSEDEVINRINAQLSLEYKKQVVDFILDNSKDINFIKLQLNKILDKIKSINKERGNALILGQ